MDKPTTLDPLPRYTDGERRSASYRDEQGLPGVNNGGYPRACIRSEPDIGGECRHFAFVPHADSCVAAIGGLFDHLVGKRESIV
jgi:hypothetical protein